MEPTLQFFSGFAPSDMWFMAQAAWRTLVISVVSIRWARFLARVFGWVLYEGKVWATAGLAAFLDIFRSVPLLIQLVLFYNLAPIVGLNLDAFASGVVVLTIYTAALVANVARGGLEAVGTPMRRAARSLGMSYWQALRYVVFPIGDAPSFPHGSASPWA
jgi:His/Glu/Gln/Arg/opine family amino acid ABC transporter permease subunit